MFNPHTKFEVSTITCNEEMKGNAKCNNFRFKPSFVAMGTSQSNFVPLNTGVPQGSVLGPLLFCLYTSPVGQLISSYMASHINSTQMTLSCSFKSLLLHLLPLPLIEQCLIQLHHWFCVNGLALNPDKSEAIWFSTRQRSASSTPVSSVK